MICKPLKNILIALLIRENESQENMQYNYFV